ATPTDVPPPVMPDGKGGGGGMMNSSLIYPGPMGGGISVDASVTKEITPDFIAVNAYCDVGRHDTRDEAKNVLQQVYTTIKNAVGKDGRVRKSGGYSIYPFYDPSG